MRGTEGEWVTSGLVTVGIGGRVGTPVVSAERQQFEEEKIRSEEVKRDIL